MADEQIPSSGQIPPIIPTQPISSLAMKKKNKMVVIGLLVLIIVITGIILMKMNKLTLEEAGGNERYCEKDSDCIVVGSRLDTNPCCWNCSSETINKIANDKRKLWEEENCRGISIYGCPVCKAAPIYWFMAFCNNNICELKSAFEECGKIDDRESKDKCYKDFETEAKKRLE